VAEIRVDTSELRQLAADLGSVSARAIPQVRAVIQKAALNIKRDLQQEATDTTYFPGVARSISYDTFAGPDGWVAEIGPEIGNPKGHPRAQGSLAWIAYEGNSRTGPAFPDPQGALEREAEAFRLYLAEAITDDLL
jgi:hypothetical protein